MNNAGWRKNKKKKREGPHPSSAMGGNALPIDLDIQIYHASRGLTYGIDQLEMKWCALKRQTRSGNNSEYYAHRELSIGQEEE